MEGRRGAEKSRERRGREDADVPDFGLIICDFLLSHSHVFPTSLFPRLFFAVLKHL